MPLFGRGRPDPPDPMLSTGHAALDAVLGGGLAPGRATLVRADGSASLADVRSEHLLLVLGAVAAGRGASVVIAPYEDPTDLWGRWNAGRRGLDFDARVRLVDFNPDRLPIAEWHVPLHPQLPARLAMRRMEHAEQAVRGPHNQGSLEITCTDALEELVGPAGAERIVRGAVNRLGVSRDWALFWGRTDGRALAAARAQAPREMALRRDGGGLSMAGIRPAFPPVFLSP